MGSTMWGLGGGVGGGGGGGGVCCGVKYKSQEEIGRGHRNAAPLA